MRRYPNATALVFIKRLQPLSESERAPGPPDLTNASLLGACYLLRGKDASGEEVLVVRGINPRERVIERYDVGSFVEGLFDDVVVPYARALGIEKVVVPFDELGHAQTNRQLINEHMLSRYADAQYVPLDEKDVLLNFNERMIFNKCRLVRFVPRG